MTLVILLNVIMLGVTFLVEWKVLAGKKVWRESFGGKESLAGKFWRPYLGRVFLREQLNLKQT